MYPEMFYNKEWLVEDYIEEQVGYLLGYIFTNITATVQEILVTIH